MPLCPRPPAGRAPRPVVCARRARAPLHPFETPAPSQIPAAPCGLPAAPVRSGVAHNGHGRALYLILRISSGGGRRGRLAGFEPSVRHCPVPEDMDPRRGRGQASTFPRSLSDRLQSLTWLSCLQTQRLVPGSFCMYASDRGLPWMAHRWDILPARTNLTNVLGPPPHLR